MPARRERLYVCPGEDGQPVRLLEFPFWWDRRAFFEKFGERQIDTGNPFYVDYGLLLTGSEAMAWDNQCRESFAKSSRSQERHVQEAMRHLASILETAGWVIVESFEWESGL
jgi:hypothetical protein